MRRAAFALLALSVYILLLVAPLGIPGDQQAVVAIVGLVAVLWFTESIPLFVTAMIIPILLVTTVGLPQRDVLQAFADPVIGLFFGSFVLAIVLAKYGFDVRIARALSAVTRRSPSKLLLGVIAFAALLGMWISNTATVSLLLPIILLFVAVKRGKTKMPRFTKALLFGLAMGAAVGGMATPVGTAPNAIAVRYLADASLSLSFLSWLSIGFPLVVLLVPTIWLVLVKLFKPEVQRLPKIEHRDQRWTSKEGLFYPPVARNHRHVAGRTSAWNIHGDRGYCRGLYKLWLRVT